MRVIVQRVQASRVEIGGEVSGQIGPGLMVLLGITEGDTQQHCDFLVDKLVHLRIFTDDQEKMNLSLQDIDGEMLIVSQFTLYGDCKKGRRPSFVAAARPETAVPLYEYFIEAAKRSGVKKVATGQFGADMQVYIQNDGPVTLMLDTDEMMKRGVK
ncbi:MAG: D-aminoacyl-tRNA deacylase [Oscillospiraceae bacterium]|nr:D-aminoacyl-tRNA deacylase [Oscillospiraceae bacterium]